MNDESAVKWQLYAALNPTVERIFPELAKEIGLNESIVLLQLAFWIQGSKYVHNGTYWTFHSLRDMQEKTFPFWSVMTVQRILKSLSDKGYILIGNFNKRKGDNTQWFALVPDRLSTLTSIIVVPVQENEVYQNDTAPYQNDTPLQQNDTTLHKTPNKSPKKKEDKDSAANAAPPRNSKSSTTIKSRPKRVRDWTVADYASAAQEYPELNTLAAFDDPGYHPKLTQLTTKSVMLTCVELFNELYRLRIEPDLWQGLYDYSRKRRNGQTDSYTVFQHMLYDLDGWHKAQKSNSRAAANGQEADSTRYIEFDLTHWSSDNPSYRQEE